MTCFLDALHRISLLSSDKAHAVKLELAPNALRLTSHNPDRRVSLVPRSAHS
jgi:DNA polymerase III subunit beta